MKMTVYHGSADVIEKPVFGNDRPFRDFGKGFYCTEDMDLAREWSVGRDHDGYANVYEIDTAGLDILNLNGRGYCILHWLSVLLENRIFTADGDLAEEGREYILKNFPVDYRNRDIIIGYRADDSYFSFAQNFLNGGISYRQLTYAMYLGKLGEQFVIKSRKAFDRLVFSKAVEATRQEWLDRRNRRDSEARSEYRDSRRRRRQPGDIYITDIIDEEMREDDPRLQ